MSYHTFMSMEDRYAGIMKALQSGLILSPREVCNVYLGETANTSDVGSTGQILNVLALAGVVRKTTHLAKRKMFINKYELIQKYRVLPREEVVKPLVKLIEATRPGQKDPLESITYTASRVREAFPNMSFQFKSVYEFLYEDGQKILFQLNSGRFYSGRLTGINMEFVQKGPNPPKVFHKVIDIRLHSNGIR